MTLDKKEALRNLLNRPAIEAALRSPIAVEDDIRGHRIGHRISVEGATVREQ